MIIQDIEITVEIPEVYAHKMTTERFENRIAVECERFLANKNRSDVDPFALMLIVARETQSIFSCSRDQRSFIFKYVGV